MTFTPKDPGGAPNAADAPDAKEQADQILARAGLAQSAQFPLFEAALAAASLDRTQSTLGAYRAHGEALVATARQMTGPGSDDGPEATQIVEALAGTIGGDFGYEGDMAGYDAPENADIMHVIDRRKGLPVALGVLYLHVARALNWAVFGVNLPGHFILGAGAFEKPVMFDPFHKGRILGDDDVADLLAQTESIGDDGGTVRVSAMTDRDVLARLMNNQRVRAAQAGDAERTAEVLRRMVLILPQAAPLWFDYGLAAQAAGTMLSAKAAFERVVALEPKSELSTNAQASLKTLRNKLN